MIVELRARFVARLRADLRGLEGTPHAHAGLTVLVGSEALAEQIRLDLTPLEQQRLHISWLRPGPCSVCGELKRSSCARCTMASCARCDRCYGCHQLICWSCDRPGTPPFTFPGDTHEHPHEHPHGPEHGPEREP